MVSMVRSPCSLGYAVLFVESAFVAVEIAGGEM